MKLEKLLNRFSLGGKYLTDPGPNREELESIVQAALRAPDHGELIAFRFTVIEGTARTRLADLFEAHALKSGKSKLSCEIERTRALEVPVSLAVIARIDAGHPMVPAHEQWMCVGGAVTNVLNALHVLGFAGKMLSGAKVRDTAIIEAFCKPGETLVGWIVMGKATRALQAQSGKALESCLSDFEAQTR
jgi:nitroreductase